MNHHAPRRTHAASLLAFAGALILAPGALAGDHAVIYHTEVTAIAGPPLSIASLAGLAVGDEVKVNFGVNGAGTALSGGLRYDAALADCSVEPPWARVFADPGATNSYVFLDDGSPDRLDAEMELPGGVLLQSAIAGPASMLSGQSLSALHGTHVFVPTGSSMQLTEGGASITLTVTDVCIYADTGGAGVGTSIGVNYCGPAVANATGTSATMWTYGSIIAADNDVRLVCRDMPVNSFGYFLMSPVSGYILNPGGSAGNLCLDGPIGRFNRPCGEIRNSGATGAFGLQVDLTNLPSPTGSIAAQAGDTYFFTCWYRDFQGTVTSNFADAVEITFI